MSVLSDRAGPAPAGAAVPWPSVFERLRSVVGPPHVITDPARLMVYESDGLTQYRVAPKAVVLPEDTAQVAAVVEILSYENVPIVARGAGTGLSGGALPCADGVVVGTARMTRIREVDPEARLARVQPGVVNGRLTEATRPYGLYYAPDPSSQSTCTLGGNVAENSGGPHCLKYGVTGRYVTGLTVVLGDGAIVRLGGAGRAPDGLIDLPGLFVGSEGCFGIATEIEVALLPLAAGVRTLLGIFETMEAAGRAVTSIIGQGMLPAALEIVDAATIRAVEASVYAAGYPKDAGAALVIEFDGTEEGLDEEVRRAEACCLEAGAREVRRAADEEERAALWKGRKKAFGAMGRIAPDLLVQDATVPRTRLPEVLARVAEIGARNRLEIANVFHAGDGNLHPNIIFDRQNPDEVRRVEEASKEIMALCVEAGGTITGEHGVGVDKRRYMRLVHGPDELDAMARVKEAFDPKGLLNPHKVLPDPEGAPVPGTAGDPAVPAASREAGAARRSGSGEGTARRPGGSPEPLRARSAKDVEETLVWATGETRRVLPVGTARHLPSWVEEDGHARLVMLDLSGVEIYEPSDLTLTAAAGTLLVDLAGVLREHGQWLPFDPPGSPHRTLGGLVASSASGPLGAAYGALRNHVLGATLVTGGGKTLRLGGRVVKNVAGFDLLRPVVGSFGALGVLTSVTVRVFPLPEEDRLLVARAAKPEDLFKVARAIATAPVVPASTVLAAGLPLDGGGGDAALVLVVRLHGSRATVDADQRALQRFVGESFEHVRPGDGAGRLLEVVRDHPAETETFGVALAHVPPPRLPEALSALSVEPEGMGTVSGPRWQADVHTGRIRFSFDAGWGEALRRVRARVEALGGSLGFERVPPGVDVREMRTSLRPDELHLQERVRAAFDPAGVLVAPGGDAVRDSRGGRR